MKNLIDKCYKLPWSELDNPNGWIEPTTYCNLRCPGCYRGADKPSHKPYHLPIDEVKQQIDWFVTNRNIHTLSIAGGEPLLYPNLLELVQYASTKKLRIMIYTNGLNLNKELLINLRDNGANQIVLHIDRFQDRPDLDKNTNIEALHQRFCDMFKEVSGILLGFIQPLSNPYIEDLKYVLSISQKNISVVSLIVFTLYRDICWEDNIRQSIPANITMKEVTEALIELDRFVPASYLSSLQNSNEATWIFATRVGNENKILGYFSPKLLKLIHEKYRKLKGKYIFISRYSAINVFKFMRFAYFSSVRIIIVNYFKSLFTISSSKNNSLYFQTILLLRGPEKTHGNWDLCENCPDRIIYNSRLVPSCILEVLRNSENPEYLKVDF